jgi:hypothetical protein
MGNWKSWNAYLALLSMQHDRRSFQNTVLDAERDRMMEWPDALSVSSACFNGAVNEICQDLISVY